MHVVTLLVEAAEGLLRDVFRVLGAQQRSQSDDPGRVAVEEGSEVLMHAFPPNECSHTVDYA